MFLTLENSLFEQPRALGEGSKSTIIINISGFKNELKKERNYRSILTGKPVLKWQENKGNSIFD